LQIVEVGKEEEEEKAMNQDLNGVEVLSEV
jgi:hypothetical protein